MSCFANGQPVDLVPKESNGGVPVNQQDQTSPPVDSYFAQEISPFTISTDTVASGITTLVYTFTASPAHGIVGGAEILLLDVAADRPFYAIALTVVGDLITVDRPIDHLFPAASTLGRIVTTEMAVDGSVTPQIFSMRAGQIPVDAVRFMITATNNNDMDYSLFAGMAALPRGLVFRIVNHFQKTIFCFKTDREIAQFCFDLAYQPKAPAGEFGLVARVTFGGQAKHGVVLRIKDTDVLQWVVQDKLDGAVGILSLKISTEGHETTD